MGFVGDLVSGIGHHFGIGGGPDQFHADPVQNGFNAQATVNPFQAQMGDQWSAGLQNTNYGGALNSAMGAGTGGALDQQQSSFADQLRAMMAGTGPSLAQQQLTQGLQQNQQMAASQVASQRGINPAMGARMIGQNQAAAGQQMAGQSAMLRSQEQLNATGMLGQALAAQRGQQIQQQGQNTNLLGTLGGLQQGQNALNLQNYMGAQGINARIAMQNAGLASHAQDINAQVAAGNQGAGMYAQGLNASAAGANAGMVDKNIGSMLGGLGSMMGMPGMGGGGAVSGGIPQNQWNAITMSPGGDVPGQAKAPGDSKSNDTVPALLSPHEIVLPRSVTLSENAPELAADFVRAIKERMGKGKGYKPAREQTVNASSGYPNPDAATNPEGPPDESNPWFPDTGAGDTAGAGLKEALSTFLPIGSPGQAPPAAPDQGPAPTQGPGMLSRPADADMVAARSQAPAPADRAQMSPPGGSGEMQRGERQQIAGIQGEATAAEGFAHAQTGIMDSWSAARQELTQRFQQEMQAHTVKSEQLFNSLLDPKNDVNPNRFWEQKSTGGKIMASIGMILGGMPAVENINKAIDRDVEAQKLNVGKKQNALSQYMQMGRDMQSAHLLASADMKDAAAAQLARAAAAYQGTKAGADAQVQIGALRQSAYQQRQQATLTDYQIQNTALNTRFMQQMMSHMGNGNFARDMQTMGFLKNPEKFAETQVNTQEDVPTGATDKNGKPLTQTQTTAYRGKSAQAMEKASEALGHNRIMDTSLTELEHFEKENPLGGTPGSEAVGRARAAIQNIRLNYEATMAGMNRQASPEVMKHMEDIAKDPTALFKTGKTSGALKFLRKMINEHKQGVLDTYTLGPTGMADGGEVQEEGGLVGSVKKYFTSGRSESAGKNVAEEASKALPKALSGHGAVETKRAQYKRAEEIAESRD